MQRHAPEPVCLLDIRGLLLRQFHTTNDKTWESGLTAFLDRVLFNEILEAYAPRQVIACWDAGNDFRLDIYPDYKKKRREKEKNPEEQKQLKLLFDKAKRFFAYLGIKNVSVNGCEADDLIALFCQKLPGPICVWTVDADLLQLVLDPSDVQGDPQEAHVMVRYLDTLYTHHNQDKDGTPLHLIRLQKSIVGDSSDGYVGIKGVGPEAWKNLIESFGIDGLQELEIIVANKDRDQLAGVVEASGDKMLNKLLNQWGEWTRSYALASLHPEACYSGRGDKINRPEWYVRVPNEEKLGQILYQMGAMDMMVFCKKWLPTEKIFDASNVEELAMLQRTLQTDPIVSWDFESYDTLKHPDFKKAAHGREYVDVLSQAITGISVNYGNNLQHTFYMPVNHADTDNVSKEWLVYLLQVLFSRNESVVQNANFELTLVQTDLGMTEDQIGSVADTAIMATYVDENLENRLKQMSLEWLGYSQTTYAEVTQGRPMNELSAVEVLSYGCDDSLVTSHLFDLFRLIMRLEGSFSFYCDNETEHVLDNVRTFIDGCPIDVPLIDQMAAEDAKVAADSDVAIRRALEENCNNRSQEEIMPCAHAVLNMWWELPALQYAGDPDKSQSAYDQLWERAWNACFYVPYEKTVEPPQFALTTTKLNELTATLGFPELRFEKSLSGNQISGWLEDADDVLNRQESSPDFLLRLIECLTKLAEASASLQKRASKGGFGSLHNEGIDTLPEYGVLIDLVNEIYAAFGKGKTIWSGDELNYASSQQMQAFLYGKLGLPVRRRGKVPAGSTRAKYGLDGGPVTGNKASAAALVYDVHEGDWRHPVLIEYRKIVACQQNASLFYGPYPLWVHPRDGMIHPQLKNCGTVTRRPSGTSPNVLQVSKKEDAKIRRVYLPWSDDYVHVSIDFKQQEVLITACEAKEKIMQDALRHGKDIHSVTSTGFAHIMLERELGRTLKKLSYEDFKDLETNEFYPGAYKTIRAAAKAVLFLVFYGGGVGTLAENLLIERELAQAIYDGLFAAYPRLAPWQEEVIFFAKEHGYVETVYGTRRHLSNELYSEDQGLRKRQQRQAINYTIQGCLQEGTRVLTDTGLVPIEDTVGKEVVVWTGTDWALATGINRGEAELLEIELESGLTIYCDTRHFLKGSDLAWHEVMTLEVGDLVALPKATGEGFSPSEYSIGWPFILGYWLGDGSMGSREVLTHSKKSTYTRYSWSICGGKKKRELLEEIMAWMRAQGLSACWRVGKKASHPDVYHVVLHKKAEISSLASHGFYHATALTKRVPEQVWSWPVEDRIQFLYGYALSDGSRNTLSPSWHSPNRELLVEVQLLLSSVGVDSRLIETTNGHILRSRLSGKHRRYPIGRLIEDLGKIEVSCSGGDHRSIVERRVWKNKDICTQVIAESIYSKYLPHKEEVYRYDKIVEIRKLDERAETYTMSVAHPLHQFVADGVIHKNTAADILKIVLTQVRNQQILSRYNVKGLKPVYDEISAMVPLAAAADYIAEMQNIMAIRPPGYPLALSTDVSVGLRWGDVEEINDLSQMNIENVIARQRNVDEAA